MIEEIEFEVGEKYENMKGVFEVISMQKDSMNIRWEDGEEVSTPINLQQRILERMRHEKELEAERIAQKAKKAKSPSRAKQFDGLEENDFNNMVSKTTWRGRGQIGRAVCHRLKSKQFDFNSWVVLRKPEVRWMDVTRQKQDDVLFQAKFYARIEPDSLGFGVHIPTVDLSASETNDWNGLLKWLEQSENDAWLLEQCTSHGLYLFDMGVKGFAGKLEADAGHWVRRPEKDESPIKSLYAFFGGLDNPDKMDLRIEKQMAKGDAIERKQGIADDIAGIFEILLPVYTAGVA